MQRINGQVMRQDETGQWYVWTNEGTLLNCWGWLKTAAPKSERPVRDFPRRELDSFLDYEDWKAKQGAEAGKCRNLESCRVGLCACFETDDAEPYVPESIRANMEG